MEGLASVEVCSGHWPIDAGELVVPMKDVVVKGHSIGEFTIDHGSQVPRVKDLAMAEEERGYWPPYIGEL